MPTNYPDDDYTGYQHERDGEYPDPDGTYFEATTYDVVGDHSIDFARGGTSFDDHVQENRHTQQPRREPSSRETPTQQFQREFEEIKAVVREASEGVFTMGTINDGAEGMITVGVASIDVETVYTALRKQIPPELFEKISVYPVINPLS